MERIKKCSNYLLFGLLSLFLCLFIFSQNTNVYAGSVPTMTIDEASAILDYFRSGDNYNYKQKNTTVPTANLYNYLTQYINSADLMNLWNNTIAPAISNNSVLSQKNLTWDNFIFSYYGFNNTQTRLGIYIVDFNNNELVKVSRQDSNKTLNISSTGTQYRTNILITSSGISWDGTIGDINNGVMRQLVNINNIVIPYTYDTQYIYTPPIFTISDNVQVIENLTSNILLNGNYAYVEPQEPISGDTESSLGYYFYDSQQEGVKEINLLSLNSFQPLNEWWYIGNDLTFTYHYYYYDRNNNSVVFADNNVDIVQSSNSGDTGKFYFPRIDRQHLDNLQNDTGYYLVLYIGSGDIVLANDFYSFVTYSSVVDSGATGTITNSSGDVTGNVDLTGVQAGINDVNETLTNVPDISNVSISSGDVYNSLGFQIASDPYANFWYEFTQSLGQALTTSTKSYLDINYLGYTYRWDLSNMHNPLPVDLQHFLQGITTCFMIYYLTKQIRILVNDLQSGGILSTAHGAVVGDDTFIAYF